MWHALYQLNLAVKSGFPHMVHKTYILTQQNIDILFCNAGKHVSTATPIVSWLVTDEPTLHILDELSASKPLLIQYIEEEVVMHLFGKQDHPVVLDAIWMNWSNEEYIEGLYSFPHINGRMRDRDILARAECNINSKKHDYSNL